MHDYYSIYAKVKKCIMKSLNNILQMDLFATWEIQLSVTYRVKQKDFKEYPYDKKIQRKRIETLFSQYCDGYMLKRNCTKPYRGIEVRIHFCGEGLCSHKRGPCDLLPLYEI